MGIPVEQVMTRDVLSVQPDMTVKQMDRALLDRNVSGAPVLDGQRLVGVVSRADAVRALYDDQSQATRISDFYTSPFPIPLPALDQLEKDSRKITRHLATLRVREIMTTDPLTVAPSDDVEEVAHLMASERVHRVPVVQDGELVGIVSSLDIVACVARLGLGAGR
jgi:CBS domain-containing protein